MTTFEDEPPPEVRPLLQPWHGGVGLVTGYRTPELLDVELAFVDGRITGPSVDVRYTPVPGGFRLGGLWFGDNVSLEVTGKGAQARADH